MAKAAIKLPLYDRHAALGARFAPFAGFEMPIRYGSIVAEHHAVRNGVGLFDVSHMGEVAFTGPAALDVVNELVTNDVGKLTDGQALYTAMCHEDGGIVDDLLIHRLAPDHLLACVNASNRTKDFNHMVAVAADRCEVKNLSDSYAQLAVQGPKAVDVLSACCDDPVADLSGFHFVFGSIAGADVLISRTGYTGEDGYELYYPAEAAVDVFDALMTAGEPHGITPVGLGARDTLRLEARLMLYGNDIDDSTTPLEAGLSWLVKFDKGDFVGRDALLAQKEAGLTRRLRGLVLRERGVLRSHYNVYLGDQRVGETTSGGPSPTLGQSVGLAYVDIAHCNVPELNVEIRGRRLACAVTRKPFYKRP